MSATATSDSYSWAASIACYGDPVNLKGYIMVAKKLKWDGSDAPALLHNNYLHYNGVGINKKVAVKGIYAADTSIYVETSAN